MQIDIENGRRFNEEPAISAVSSGADIVLVRLADGTGVKALPLSALRDFAAGDITALETEDKTSLVAAVNERNAKQNCFHNIKKQQTKRNDICLWVIHSLSLGLPQWRRLHHSLATEARCA